MCLISEFAYKTYFKEKSFLVRLGLTPPPSKYTILIDVFPRHGKKKNIYNDEVLWQKFQELMSFLISACCILKKKKKNYTRIFNEGSCSRPPKKILGDRNVWKFCKISVWFDKKKPKFFQYMKNTTEAPHFSSSRLYNLASLPLSWFYGQFIVWRLVH